MSTLRDNINCRKAGCLSNPTFVLRGGDGPPLWCGPCPGSGLAGCPSREKRTGTESRSYDMAQAAEGILATPNYAKAEKRRSSRSRVGGGGRRPRTVLRGQIEMRSDGQAPAALAGFGGPDAWATAHPATARAKVQPFRSNLGVRVRILDAWMRARSRMSRWMWTGARAAGRAGGERGRRRSAGRGCAGPRERAGVWVPRSKYTSQQSVPGLGKRDTHTTIRHEIDKVELPRTTRRRRPPRSLSPPAPLRP